MSHWCHTELLVLSDRPNETYSKQNEEDEVQNSKNFHIFLLIGYQLYFLSGDQF
jgi:hypothetical protein